MSLAASVVQVLSTPSHYLQALCHAKEVTPGRRHPIFIGLSGLQGSGKSTWASVIVELLSSEYRLKAIQVSLDDFYKTHEQLVKLRDDNPDNMLLRTRGQPGTHDEQLARDFFERLRDRTANVRIPVFDKSQHHGEGDRLDEEQWPIAPPDVDVVVFEGWCVGFQPVEKVEIHKRWKSASQVPIEIRQAFKSTVTLADHQIEHLEQINDNLDRYCQTFMGPEQFDFFIHLDTDDLANVYTWRLQQEQAMIKARGSGMPEQQVANFVRGYMPAYELYLDTLRAGIFSQQDSQEVGKRHIRVCLGRCREVLSFQAL